MKNISTGTIFNVCILFLRYQNPAYMEFRFSKSARIAAYIFGSLFIAVGIFLTGYAFYGQMFLIIIGFLLISMGWAALKEVRSSSLTLDDDSITLVNSRTFRTLPLHDVQGFRRLPKGMIELLPVPGTGKKMTISSSFEKKNEIEAWLEAHLPDVDAVTVQQETEAILADEHFGLSETDRAARLQQATQTARVLNIAAYVVALWGFIYPYPYNIVVIVLLAFPFIAFAVIWYFKGLVQLADGKKSAFPSVASAVLMPSLALLLRAIVDYDIYDYNTVFKPAIMLFAVALAVAWVASRKMLSHTTQKPVTIITLLACVCCYAYGAVIVINSNYDTTPAKTYTVKVKGKHISTGKHTSYYLRLDAWGRYTKAEDVDVPSNLYNAEKEGDMVNVNLKKGYLGIPWFWVESGSRQ